MISAGDSCHQLNGWPKSVEPRTHAVDVRQGE